MMWVLFQVASKVSFMNFFLVIANQTVLPWNLTFKLKQVCNDTQNSHFKEKHVFLSFFFLGLSAFTAALIYTLHNKEILQDSRELTLGRFGYCFILAWVCVPLLLCSGIMYIHLRKKEWPGKEKNTTYKRPKETKLLSMYENVAFLLLDVVLCKA